MKRNQGVILDDSEAATYTWTIQYVNCLERRGDYCNKTGENEKLLLWIVLNNTIKKIIHIIVIIVLIL